MHYAPFFTKTSQARQPSAIRALQRYLDVPGMISLGGGSPNPSTFPLKSMQITLKTNKRLEITNINEALQYSSTTGLPQLVNHLTTLQLSQHNPVAPFKICVGTGSQDVLTKAFDMLLSRNDSLLIESPTYSGSLAYLKPLGCGFVEVKMDNHGIIPEHLDNLLVNWENGSDPLTSKIEPRKDRKEKPHVLYTIPTGSNPSGITTTTARKHEIYAIAQAHNLLILEDDPYYYLNFTAPLPESYLSMDVDGRVLRFDSLSKVVGAGLRVGWVTAHPDLVERIEMHSQATNLHTSGMSQSIVIALFNHWGLDGFLEHVRGVAKFYEGKRDFFVKSAEKHLTGLATWEVPNAGMFVWIKLTGVEDSALLIRGRAIENKIILIPGVVSLSLQDMTIEEFFPDDRISGFVRAAYSTASEAQIDTALQRLATLLREN